MRKIHPVYHWYFVDINGVSLPSFLEILFNIEWENILDLPYIKYRTSSQTSLGRHIFELISTIDNETIAAIDATETNKLVISVKWRPDMIIFPNKIVQFLEDNFVIAHYSFHPPRS